MRLLGFALSLEHGNLHASFQLLLEAGCKKVEVWAAFGVYDLVACHCYTRELPDTAVFGSPTHLPLQQDL